MSGIISVSRTRYNQLCHLVIGDDFVCRGQNYRVHEKGRQRGPSQFLVAIPITKRGGVSDGEPIKIRAEA